jgi:DNA-directed RNA polymerase specialized sigma24 family protein
MKQWTLSKSSFDNFLAVLDADRYRAAQKYESLRTRLVKFFEWRACRFADNLADETLDRVARKIDLGEQINDHLNYTYGVARLVYLETVKQQAKEQAVIINLPVSNNGFYEENPQLGCLEACLEKLSEANRKMILHYYYNDKQAKIDYRKKLAEKLEISLNALRIKTLRIRAKLEECVLKCLKNGAVKVK